ncbi:hypothetical protein LUZ62_088731 [Rhynchospora pubera]|uniref:RING-type E3 ubiquitin transferase n=2 Tax=Rhynchospora pubera TaxID=906938 RepID=A0AAV8CG23_9POAL|nr:hypothetical protein LUZ62_088731 [Rhynchospora pubera]
MNWFMHSEVFSPPIQFPLPYLPPPATPPLKTPPPPLPLSPYQNLLQNKLSPSILLVIIILAIIFFISALLHLLVRFLLKRANHDSDSSELNSVTAMQGQLQQLFHLHDAGVDQSFIDTLPIFQYKTIIGLKDPFDCAVCLCEFEEDDNLRLLPKCSHAFHVDCIDTWLLTHSTCPLCRRSLLVDNFSPNNSRGATLFILESASESSREIASDRVEPGSNSNLSSLRENEMSPSVEENLKKTEEKVVAVKLGKFKCVENEVREGEGTSNGNKSNKGNLSSRRRCFSMGSYEYVMNEQTSLCVTIKPPKKKPIVRKPSRRRLAMSECDCYSKRDGFKAILDSSRFSCAPAESTRSSISLKGNIQRKDSFSVSKIWMVPRKDQDAPLSDDFKRRAVSFRLPLHRPPPVGDMSPVKLLGLGNSIGSEMDWDLEEGSCNNGSSIGPSIADEAAVPSFARRTLLWVIGRQNKS